MSKNVSIIGRFHQLFADVTVVSCHQGPLLKHCFMMTSSNGCIYRVAGPLCGEFSCHRWIPLTKASDAELWCFRWSCDWVNNQDAGGLRRHRAHDDVTEAMRHGEINTSIVFIDGIAKPTYLKLGHLGVIAKNCLCICNYFTYTSKSMLDQLIPVSNMGFK